jgi:integrase
MATRLEKLMERKPEKSTIKTFQHAFQFALSTHDKWSLNREKNSQGHNARRFMQQLEKFCESDAIPIAYIADDFNVKQIINEMQDHYNWSDSSCNKFCSFLSTTFKECLDHDMLAKMPRIPRKAETMGRTEWYTKEHVEQLCGYAKETERHKLADLMLFAAYTGLRQQELRKLKRRDFDYKLNVPLIHVGGTKDSITKTGNYRTVQLPERIHELAERLCHHKDANDLIFGEDWINRQQINRAFNPVKSVVKTRVDGITDAHVFHTFRHTYGTWRIAAGSPIMDVKFAMGHSTVAMTERYVHNTGGVSTQGDVRI